MDFSTIFFARPGPTDDNIRPTTHQSPNGSYSLDDKALLNTNGLSDARNVGEKFKLTKFHAAYCSQALRTRQTVEEILQINEEVKHLNIIESPSLYEMKLGCTGWMDPKDFIELFKQKTGYPNPEKCPNAFAKRQGGNLEAIDVYLDKWDEHIDTIQDFSKCSIEGIREIALAHLGKNLLFVPHGTPIKAMIGAAEGISPDRIKVARGAYGVIKVDALGNFTFMKDQSTGISW